MYKRILTFAVAVVLTSCGEYPRLQVKVRKLDGTNLSEICHVSMGYSVGDTLSLFDKNNDRKHYTIVAIIDTIK